MTTKIKLLLVAILGFLIIAAASEVSRDRLPYNKIYDSLKSTRLQVKIPWDASYLYSSIIFDQIASTDSVGIYALTDSIHNKHGYDTIPLYTRNISTFSEYGSGLIDSLTSPVELSILSPNIEYLLIKLLDRQTTKPTVYFRMRGVTF